MLSRSSGEERNAKTTEHDPNPNRTRKKVKIGTETPGTIQKSRDNSKIQERGATHLLISTDVRTESPEY